MKAQHPSRHAAVAGRRQVLARWGGASGLVSSRASVLQESWVYRV